MAGRSSYKLEGTIYGASVSRTIRSFDSSGWEIGVDVDAGVGEDIILRITVDVSVFVA